MHTGHGRSISHISMPRDPIDIFIRCRITKLSNRPAPQAVVMIENPYLRLHTSTAQRGPKMLLHKLNLVLLPPQTSRHAPILIRIHFILDRNCINHHSIRLVSLQKLQEVLRVRIVTMLPHRPAQHRPIRLHPSRRRPGRRKQKQLRIRLPRLAQHWQDISLVMLDRKLLQLRIWFVALIKRIHRPRIIARPNASPANVERHLPRRKQIMHHRPALVSSHLAQHPAGSIRHRPAKPQHLLLRRRRVQHNRIRRNPTHRLPHQRLTRRIPLIPISSPNPHRPRRANRAKPGRRLRHRQSRSRTRSSLQEPPARTPTHTHSLSAQTFLHSES